MLASPTSKEALQGLVFDHQPFSDSADNEQILEQQVLY